MPIPAIGEAPTIITPHQIVSLRVPQADQSHLERLFSNTVGFSKDTESGRVLLKITDDRYGDIIRQVPSPQDLVIDKVVGQFLDRVA